MSDSKADSATLQCHLNSASGFSTVDLMFSKRIGRAIHIQAISSDNCDVMWEDIIGADEIAILRDFLAEVVCRCGIEQDRQDGL